MISKNGIILGLLLVLVSVGSGWGAKVILKEGKVLHGRIINETDSEIMMILGTNMTLRVDKKKIKEIVRTKKSTGSKNVVTMDDLKEDDEETKKPKKTSPKKTPSKKVPSSPVKRIKEQKKSRNMTKKTLSILETRVFQTYDVDGDTFDEAMDAIHRRDGGKGIATKKGKRLAGDTSIQVNWKGDAKKEGAQFRLAKIVLTSTITSTFPAWDAPKDVAAEDIKSWNQFLDQLQASDKTLANAYVRDLQKLGESLEAIREPSKAKLKTEGERQYARAKKRMEKRKGAAQRGSGSKKLQKKLDLLKKKKK